MARKKKQAGTGFITDMDRYLFGNGTHYEIYRKLGAHMQTYEGKKGMYFAVWAPHATSVSLVCDRNKWLPEANPMKLLETSGIWETFIPDMGYGELYKYAIATNSGKVLFKADPYAFSSEYRPGTASITADIDHFKWGDGTWMAKRKETDLLKAPMSIYEVHLGSWRKKEREEKDGVYTYKEAAQDRKSVV